MLPGEIDASYVQDHGASLCMHLIMPMLTVSDYQLYDTVFSWRKRHLLLAVLLPSYGCCSFTCWAGSVCAGDHRQHGDTLPLLKLLRSRQLVRFYARDDGVHNSWHRRVLCDTAALFVGAARALLLMLVRQAFRKKTEHNKVSLRGV